MNIFSVIARVTSRVEPFHSRFLAEALRTSLAGDRSFASSFIRLASAGAWSDLSALEVVEEDLTLDGRVDVVIVDRLAGRVLGVEVKTHEASCTPGQLERYVQGLANKYSGLEVTISYLTPFNRHRAGDFAGRLTSVREYDLFVGQFPNSTHLSWLDVADLYEENDQLLNQHREYIRKSICSFTKLAAGANRSRGFEVFFGDEAVALFGEALATFIGSPSGNVIPLQAVSDVAGFAAAFQILIESETVRKDKIATDKFDPSKRRVFLTSPFGQVHQALFDLSEAYPHVWLEGKKDYALRVSVKGFPSVSVLRSRGSRELIVGQNR